MAKRQWVWVRTLTAEEKAAIAERCDRLIAETLKPRCLPEIRPTQWNYPIDLYGRWRGSKYSFIVRYRSGFPDNAGEEFEAACARLDHVEEHSAETRFNVMWFRHTGKWWLLHREVPIEEALHLVATDGVLRPPI
jgi:hypothetical protein